MEMRALGRSGLSVPVIGMGTWRTLDVSWPETGERCRGVVSTALAGGARLFDTSPMYGRAERVLARCLDGRRDEALVATKVWTPSAREGREQIARALDWYGGRVDVYQVHNLVNWQEHLPYLEELRGRGQVGVVGATHYSHGALPELLRLMQTARIGQIQIPYNVQDRVVEKDILPAAGERGIGVIVMQPLGVGTLTQRAPGADALEPLEKFGVRTWAQALLKWILSDSRVHCAIPATSSVTHMQENAAAGEPPWFDVDARKYVTELVDRR
jgi:aryl-alcohol dehydrogenase-like predicted oxidoreductase